MNTNPENNTDTLVFQEIEIDESAKETAVLISRDYYSEDSDFGRTLLASFLDTLISKASKGNLVLLINGCGTKLLNTSSILAELISVAGIVYICSYSLSSYNVEFKIEGNIVTLDSHAFFDEVIKYKPSVTI